MRSTYWTSALVVVAMLAMAAPTLAQTCLPDRQWFPQPSFCEPAVSTAPLGSPVVHEGTGAPPPPPNIFGPEIPNTVIRGEVRGDDLVLTFPNNTLDYTVSFNASGVRVPQRVLCHSRGIDWINANELRVSMRMLKRHGGSLENLWASGQLRSGEALLQRVHFQTPIRPTLTEEPRM